MTKHGKEVMLAEAKAVTAMAERLDERFDQAVELIGACDGRVIVTGMGKSGLIARKIVATFNSTGISSFFLHPAEALHGDLGLIQAKDILMMLSKSGQMEEADMIIAAARRMSVKIIGLCGTVDSPLYKRSDISLDCSVESEACPNNLVPTSSSTAALVMGDALAVALLMKRGFKAPDFAALHPAGSLGRRLLVKVSEIQHTGEAIPIVKPDASMADTIVEMTSKRLGCVLTTDSDGRPAKIFTDGDLRRLVERTTDFSQLTADEVMRADPLTIKQDVILDAALATMEKHSITAIPTVDDNGRLAGMIHLHDIIRSKLV